MITNKINSSLLTALISGVLLTSCSEKYTSEVKDGVTIVSNQNGATLGYSAESGITILSQDRYAFKDLNKNGTLDN